MMDKQLMQDLKAYADLKLQAKQIEGRLQALGAKILESVKANNLNSLETCSTRWGTFQIKTKRIWSYSDDCQQQEASLKALKKLEETNGAATLKQSTSYLAFTAPKAEKTSSPLDKALMGAAGGPPAPWEIAA